MPEYEFFVSGDAPRPATTAMRSHAMRTALASRSRSLKEPIGQPQVVPGSSQSRRTEELKGTLRSRFRLSDKADKDSRRASKKCPAKELLPIESTSSRSPSPGAQDSRLGTRSLDPFRVLPVENNWRVDRLIQYCRVISMCYLTVPFPADDPHLSPKSSRSSLLTYPKTSNRGRTSAWPCQNHSS